ncbi:MAG: hypothetical protein P8N76_20205 [Pirellulaceae bacterium]|nr:hypothetical protein [Pirellulaceae bacterium]
MHHPLTNQLRRSFPKQSFGEQLTNTHFDLSLIEDLTITKYEP